MSSKHYTETRTAGGIFSSDESESPLWNANKAYLAYCSSDGHMGLVGTDDKADTLWNWKFRGQAIVRAMINHLMTVQGLGEEGKQHTVVFGGSSAGGRGAMTHLDQVAKKLSEANVKTLGLLDSPLYLDLDPLDPTKGKGLNQLMESAYHNFQEHDFMPKDCLDAFNEKHQWRCNFGQHRLHFVQTPFVLFADQFDDYQMYMNIHKKSHDTHTPAE